MCAAGVLINTTDDGYVIAADSSLPDSGSIVLPRWVPASEKFADGSLSIREVFVRLVTLHGTLQG